MLDFMIKFIQSSAVGLVASAHLARADRQPNGVFDEEVLDLVRLYCIHLDFAKTGYIENFNASQRPLIYPDFMSKVITQLLK